MVDRKYNSIDEVMKIVGEGLFASKSGGTMNVPLNLPIDVINRDLLTWDETCVGAEKKDIRGLRVYTMANIPTDKPGAMEMHRVRREMIYTTRGRVLWTLEDLYGDKVEIETSPFETKVDGKHTGEGADSNVTRLLLLVS